MAKTSKIALPPRKQEKAPQLKKVTKPNEKKIQDVISKGGSLTKNTQPVEQVFKNINIKILDSELRTVHDLRDQRPKPRGKAIAISLHDWIIEAIQEKIEREKKSYKV